MSYRYGTTSSHLFTYNYPQDRVPVEKGKLSASSTTTATKDQSYPKPFPKKKIYSNLVHASCGWAVCDTIRTISVIFNLMDEKNRETRCSDKTNIIGVTTRPTFL